MSARSTENLTKTDLTTGWFVYIFYTVFRLCGHKSTHSTRWKQTSVQDLQGLK